LGGKKKVAELLASALPFFYLSTGEAKGKIPGERNVNPLVYSQQQGSPCSLSSVPPVRGKFAVCALKQGPAKKNKKGSAGGVSSLLLPPRSVEWARGKSDV